MRRWRVALVEYVNAEMKESAVGEAIRTMDRKYNGGEMPSAWVVTEEVPSLLSPEEDAILAELEVGPRGGCSRCGQNHQYGDVCP